MNGIIMLALILGVIYVAFNYLKGPGNSDQTRNNSGMPFSSGGAGSEMWNQNPPELPENDVTEMEPDGEDTEVIRYENEEEEDAQDEAVNVFAPEKSAEAPAEIVEVPASGVPADIRAAPAVNVPEPTVSMPEAPADFCGVVVDTEVHIDAGMSSNNE